MFDESGGDMLREDLVRVGVDVGVGAGAGGVLAEGSGGGGMLGDGLEVGDVCGADGVRGVPVLELVVMMVMMGVRAGHVEQHNTGLWYLEAVGL